MASLAKNTLIDANTFKNRLKEVVNAILPTSYWDQSNCPDSQMKFMLSTRSDVINYINSLISYNTNIQTDANIINGYVFDLIKEVFVEMGRCRRIYYQNAQSSHGAGSQASPLQVANDVGATESGTSGTWAYFPTAFNWTGNYNAPTTQPNGNKDETGYKTLPEKGTNNWHQDTRRQTGTAKIATMDENQLIQAVENVEAQMTNFNSEWSSRSNKAGWWSGSASDTSNTSNRVFFVRYWCHSNCHSNCHGSRSRR